MARKVARLSALGVSKLTKPGMYSDGGGLYLRVGPTGAKSWQFRYMANGKRHDMGLGPLHTVSLMEARAKANECRKQRLDGINPLAVRNEQRAQDFLEKAKAICFNECAEAYIAAHEPGWRNAKHASQWRNTLTTYAYPAIGNLPIATIDTGLVLKVIEPIWQSKSETAVRVRGRIESILDWATVRNYRTGENPARWKGHLDKLLPPRSKVQKVEHHRALPYQDIAEFMNRLRSYEGIAAKGLEFLILTAARTGEVVGAQWKEFDFKEKTWVIPAVRMKAEREHRVPLSPKALEIVQEMQQSAVSEYVFPGQKLTKPLSNMAFLELLKRMNWHEHATAHGFRSTFRDWSAECTNFPREVAEMALAHTIGDKVEAAYRRGDLFEKRRHLMADWADFCNLTSHPTGLSDSSPM